MKTFFPDSVSVCLFFPDSVKAGFIFPDSVSACLLFPDSVCLVSLIIPYYIFTLCIALSVFPLFQKNVVQYTISPSLRITHT